MSVMSVQELKTLFEQLSQEYEYLVENRNRLEADCNKLKDHIEGQVQQIKQLNGDFDKLKQDYLARSGDAGRQPQAAQIAANPADQQNFAQYQQDAIQPQLQQEEQPEQDWELEVIADNDPKKVIIALLAEIVDISVICSTAFSPDGTCLAIGSDKTLRVYNIENDDFLLQYSFEDSEEGASKDKIHIRSISWTADNKQIVCGGEDGQIRIIELPSGNLVNSFVACSGEVFQVQISNNGEFFAAATGDGSLSLFSMTNNYQKLRDAMTRTSSEDKQVIATSLAISADDKIIAVGYSDNYVVFWNPKTGQRLCEQSCHNNGVYAVKFLPEYNRFVTASLDFTIKIWNIVPNAEDPEKLTLELWKTLEGHENFVLSLATDSTDTWLLSGSKDLTACLSYIDKDSAEMIYRIKAHTNSVITVAFNPKDKMFCTGSGDQSVKIWSITEEETEEPE